MGEFHQNGSTQLYGYDMVDGWYAGNFVHNMFVGYGGGMMGIVEG
ncbi:hypothetical protein A2U01_0073857, partial [Trifolium medium]|nr:hypothetical protein [Trifolium medium]